MNRRELLRNLGLAAASLPLSSAMLVGCSSDIEPVADASSRFKFNDELSNLVKSLVDLIIPKTDTPGASEAGVVEFIELMLGEWFSDDERAKFIVGLDDVNARSADSFGTRFIDANLEQKTTLIEQLEQAAVDSESGTFDRTSFVSRLKTLTLTGYYTSQAGATDELDITMAFTSFEGCVEVGPDTRALLPMGFSPE